MNGNGQMTFWDLIAKVIDLADRRCTFTAYLVITTTLAAFTLLLIAMFHTIPLNAQSFVFGSIGSVLGYVAAIVQFKFGSSAQGQKKTDAIIAKMNE